MKAVWNSFRIAIAMYSKIPMKTPDWSKDNMKYVMCFFPFVGFVIGGIVFAWGSVGSRLGFGNTFVTGVLVLLPVLITGGIHLDGLLDTADALNSYQSTERKLEILKDPHTGAFATITGICYFILAFAAWSEVRGEALTVMAGGFLLSRALSGLSVVTFRCGKSSGLAATFSDAASKRVSGIVMLLYIVAASFFMLKSNLVLGSLGVVSAFLTFWYYRKMSYKQFGGITGDLAGYFLQICELIMALSVVIGSKIETFL